MAKQLWEDEARDRFVEYLRLKENITYETLAEDVPVTATIGGTNFDYLLDQEAVGGHPIALEIFRLTPAEYQLKQDVAWGEIVELLKVELEKLGVTGFLIRTPHFSVSKPKRQSFVADLARRLVREISANAGTAQFEYDGYTVTRIPDLTGVLFSSLGGASFYDPISMGKACLDNNIEKKNRQLALSAGYRRILFIVNFNPLVDPHSLLVACSRYDFEKYSNIDEVYYESTPRHTHLVFDRSIHTRLQTEKISIGDLESPYVLKLLSAKLNDRDPHAFNICRKLAEATKSLEWLDIDGLHALIPIAEEFLEKEDLENALWIIRQLRSNSDADVRALLCWPIQKMIVKNVPKYYPELLDILENYADDFDETVRAYVPIPLTEFAKRRKSLNDDGSLFMSIEVGQRIRAVALKMIQAATGPVAERLAGVFDYIRDLSDKEAFEVVQVLSANVEKEGRGDVASLMIYFAVYRSGQFLDLGTFDPTRLQALLIETLSSGRPTLRSSIVWTIWRGMKEDVNVVDVLPYLCKVTDGEYDRSTFGHLYRIISERLKAGDKRFCHLFLSAIQREAVFLAGSADRQVWHFDDFWQSIRITKTLCNHTFEEIRSLLEGNSTRLGVSKEFIARF
jgi:hypothetical protein